MTMEAYRIGDRVEILSGVPRHLKGKVGVVEDVQIVRFRSGTQISYKVCGLYWSGGELQPAP